MRGERLQNCRGCLCGTYEHTKHVQKGKQKIPGREKERDGSRLSMAGLARIQERRINETDTRSSAPNEATFSSTSHASRKCGKNMEP